MRLTEVRDAGPLPPVEDEIRLAGSRPGRVALEHADATTTAGEPDRRGQPREPAAHDSDVRPDRLPRHEGNHARRLQAEQGERS